MKPWTPNHKHCRVDPCDSIQHPPHHQSTHKPPRPNLSTNSRSINHPVQISAMIPKPTQNQITLSPSHSQNNSRLPPNARFQKHPQHSTGTSSIRTGYQPQDSTGSATQHTASQDPYSDPLKHQSKSKPACCTYNNNGHVSTAFQIATWSLRCEISSYQYTVVLPP